MPLRCRRLFARAAHRLPRHRGTTVMAIALAVATILPATVAGAGGAHPAPVPVFETIQPRSTATVHEAGAATVNRPTPDAVGLASDATGQFWVRADIAGNGAVGIDPGADAVATINRAEIFGGSGWRMPSGPTGTPWIPIAWDAGATDTQFAISTVEADGQFSIPMSLSVLADGDAPVASIEGLTVEQGELTLRWSDTDGSGSGIVARDVRLEEALATPSGCGPFSARGRISLGQGDFEHGVLSLGPPPSSGCLRVSLDLTDLVGHASMTIAKPYRIEIPSTTKANAAAVARWAGRFNLYRAGTFVTQKRFTWCVAASVQMMVNLVRHHTDLTTGTQATMIEYAQLRDEGPYGEGGGTDLTGWISALRHFGAGHYRAAGTNTAAEALRTAAIAMRQTGRPAGILVMEGRHAWVLHGFESLTDPRRDPRAWIRAVRISGPLYPVQQKNGYDPKPNSRMSVKALARYFQPSSVGALAGKYVVVIPTH